jgi:hypothetical protein
MSVKKRNNEIAHTARLQFLFLIVSVGTIGCAIVLALLHHALSTPTIADPSVLIPRHRVGLNPKPDERFVFVILAFLVPVASYWAIIAAPEMQAGQWSSFWKVFSWLLPVTIATAFFAPFIGFDFSPALVTGQSQPPEHPLRFLAGCLAASLVWCGWLGFVAPRRRRGQSLVSGVAWAVFISAMLLQLFAWRVFGEASMAVAATWWNSMDAVVYPVNQVVGGKTLLADLPSQYGLFAEFVSPIFKIAGLSIIKFTVLCALLQVASLSAVFYVMQKVVRDVVLKIAFGVAFVMVTFETCLWFIEINELYFQYWPIRFFWPAMSVLAFYTYTNRRDARRAA